MRISSNRSDPGYQAFARAQEQGNTIRVFLNGEEVQKCTVADEEAGFVIRRVLDAEGRLQTDPTNPKVVWEERAEGEIQISIERNAQAPRTT